MVKIVQKREREKKKIRRVQKKIWSGELDWYSQMKVEIYGGMKKRFYLFSKICFIFFFYVIEYEMKVIVSGDCQYFLYVNGFLGSLLDFESIYKSILFGWWFFFIRQ